MTSDGLRSSEVSTLTPSVKHCLKNVFRGWVLGTLNQEDPEFEASLSYKRPYLRKEWEGEWEGGRKGGEAGTCFSNRYLIVCII